MDDYDGLFVDLGNMDSGTVDIDVDPSAPHEVSNDMGIGGSAQLAVPTSDGLGVAMDDPPAPPSVAPEAQNAEDKALTKLLEEFRVMPLARGILEKIRDSADPAEVKKAVEALDEKVKSCENFLDTLPGGNMTCDDQIRLLEKLETKLQRKRDLIQRYRDLPVLQQYNVDLEEEMSFMH